MGDSLKGAHTQMNEQKTNGDIMRFQVSSSELRNMTLSAPALAKTANELVINSQDKYDVGSDLLVEINSAIKNTKKMKDVLFKPIKDHLKSVEQNIRVNISDPLESARNGLRQRMVTWHTQQENIRKKKEEEDRKEREKKALEDAEKISTVDPGLAEQHLDREIIEQQVTKEEPKYTTRTERATTTVKTIVDFEIVDESKVPREFMQVNHPSITSFIRMKRSQKVPVDKIEIPGVRVFEKKTIASRGA